MPITLIGSKKRLFLAGLVVSGLLIALWISGVLSHQPTNRSVRIAVTAGTPLVAPVHDSVGRGLWTQAGLDTQLNRLLLGRACLDAVLAGQADLATVAETPLVYAASQGFELEVLGTLGFSNKHVHVAARRSHGIRTPADLEGKTVATAFGTVHEYYLYEFMKHDNIDIKKLKLVNYDPKEMARALEAGIVSAAVFWNPYLNECQKQVGEDLLVFPPGDYYTTYYALVARKGYTAADPERANRIIKLLNESDDYLKGIDAAGLGAIADELPMQRTLLAEIWPLYRFEAEQWDEMHQVMLREADWLTTKDPRAGERAKARIPSFFTHGRMIGVKNP